MMKNLILLDATISFITGIVITFFLGFILQKRKIKQQQKWSAEYLEKQKQDESFPKNFVELPNYAESVGWPIKFWCVGNWCRSKYSLLGLLENVIIWGAIIFIFYSYISS